MQEVVKEGSSVRLGRHLRITFQRALRVPDDERIYRIPPEFGAFPVCRVEDYADTVPAAWKDGGGLFVPMYQREALWLDFEGAYWRPNAVQITIGETNVLTGKSPSWGLRGAGQDYIVCPDQAWLDGMAAGDGYIRQLVPESLAGSARVGEHRSEADNAYRMCIRAYEPKTDRFPEHAPSDSLLASIWCALAADQEMGRPSVGKMRQCVYPDEHGVDSWDEGNFCEVFVRLVNSRVYREITGEEMPQTPVKARTYKEYGLPWLDRYAEGEECTAGNGAPGRSAPDARQGRPNRVFPGKAEKRMVLGGGHVTHPA